MGDDNLRAMAERVRRIKEADVRSGPGWYGLLMEVYDEHYANDAENAFAHDEGLLADAYLAEHPADNDEPVTTYWLLLLGFSIRGLVGPDVYGIETGHDAATLLVDLTTAAWWLAGDDGLIGVRPQATRGDVRRLLRALGVPLTEGGTT